MTASLPQVALLGRQPIVDAQQQLVGYELTLQAPAPEPGDGVPPATAATAAALICATYAELGIRTALGRSTAFLRMDDVFLHDDAVEALPADAVVLELTTTAPANEHKLARCRALKDRHYVLALADYDGLDACSGPLLALVDYVTMDVHRHDDAALAMLAGPLARLPLKLVATGVDTPAMLQRCQRAGFQLFQGRHFAQADVVSGRRLTPSQTAVLRLLDLAARDSETRRLEEEFKRDTALAINLLRIVNSVGFGLVRHVGSLSQAITLLGRRQLQRWLQLLLMTPAGQAPDTSRAPLLQVAALRGRMLELLIETQYPGDKTLADGAFITGLMSMMPVALGLPMNEIFQQISLAPEVRQALAEHAGPLGRTLALLESYDAEDQATCDHWLREIAHPALQRDRLNRCLAEGLRWVNGSSDDCA